jgi:hypothetical protein
MCGKSLFKALKAWVKDEILDAVVFFCLNIKMFSLLSLVGVAL